MKTLKYPLLLLLSVLLFSCSKRNDLKIMGINGDVRWIKETSFQPFQKDSVWVSEVPEGDIREIEVDKDGFFVSLKVFNVLDELKQIALYDVKFQKTDKISVFDAERNLVGYTLYSYPIKKMSIGIDYDTNNVKQTEVAILFENGLPKKQVLMLPNSEQRIRWDYNYDNSQNLVEEIISDNNGQIIGKKRYRYLKFDSEKNWIKRLVFDNDNKWPEDIQQREYQYY